MSKNYIVDELDPGVYRFTGPGLQGANRLRISCNAGDSEQILFALEEAYRYGYKNMQHKFRMLIGAKAE